MINAKKNVNFSIIYYIALYKILYSNIVIYIVIYIVLKVCIFIFNYTYHLYTIIKKIMNLIIYYPNIYVNNRKFINC